MIAALYVATNGPYFGLPDVDPWDIHRDARLYAGPWPVVAHPPCERWGRYWGGGPMLQGTPRQKIKGDDGGCFAAAFAAVRQWGGVLEHPEGSHAWRAFNIVSPPKEGCWVRAGIFAGGWTCCVEQGHYGHRARKATWLYYVGEDFPPRLKWGPSDGERLDEGFHSSAERHQRRADGDVPCKRLSKVERLSTPIAFRDVLISMARNAVSTRPGAARAGD